MNHFKSIPIVLCWLVCLPNLAPAGLASSQNDMRVMIDKDFVSIVTDQTPLLRYRYGDVFFKPYVLKLYSPKGVNILRDAPADHLHHRGLMLAITADGVNFWEQHQSCGRQIHGLINGVSIEKVNLLSPASFQESLDWLDPTSGRSLLNEQRKIEVRLLKDASATLLTWQSKFEVPAGKESTVITGKHYHGLGMRFPEWMDKIGRLRNADEATPVIFRGKEKLVKSTWCAYSAKAEDKDVTVAMFDHPDNRRPATWFMMREPFAYLSATMNLHKKKLEVTSDRPLVLRYAVVICDGQTEKDRINRLYQQWITEQKQSK